MMALLLAVCIPASSFAGQALIALHRKNGNLDAVASRSAKNVAVRQAVQQHTLELLSAYVPNRMSGTGPCASLSHARLV